MSKAAYETLIMASYAVTSSSEHWLALTWCKSLNLAKYWKPSKAKITPYITYLKCVIENVIKYKQGK